MSVPVRIFSDFACPYCYIAKGLIDQLSRELPLSVFWVPHELHPEVPRNGMPLSEKYPGFDAAAFTEKMNQAGEAYGFSFVECDLLVNTALAIRAAEYARDENRFEAFHGAIFEALFSRNENIGKPDVLRNIATKTGLDPDQMEAAIASGRFESRLRTAGIESAERNIRMTPTFVIPGGGTIVGLPSKERLRKALLAAGA